MNPLPWPVRIFIIIVIAMIMLAAFAYNAGWWEDQNDRNHEPKTLWELPLR